MKRSLFAYLAACLAILLGRFAMILWPLDHPIAHAPHLQWIQLLPTLVLGGVALLMAEAAGCAKAWDPDVDARRRWFNPAVAGLAFACVEILISLALDFPNIHMPFPSSMAVYGAFGATYEIRQHLIPLGAALWIVGTLLLRGRWSQWVFWLAAIGVSLSEPIGQVGGLLEMGLFSGPAWTVFFFTFVFAANLAPVFLLRRGGLFALLMFRLANYALWHVIWPTLYF